MPHSHALFHRRRNWFDDASDWWNENTPWGDDDDNRHSHDNHPDSNLNNNDEQDQSQHTNRADGNNGGAAVVTVFSTVQPTFKGAIGGYSTQGQEPAATNIPNAKTSQQERKPQPTSGVQADANRKPKASTSVPTAIRNTHKASDTSGVLAHATGKATTTELHRGNGAGTPATTGTPSIDESLATSSSDSTAKDSSNDSGTSAGAKAGIAFGVLGGLLIIGLAVFFIVSRRRKRANRDQIDNGDEKLNDSFGAAAATPANDSFGGTDPKAPRISLRPVTQFFPGWNPDKRASRGAAVGLAPAAAAGAAAGAASRGGGQNGWDRPSTSQSTHSANPFGAQAERVPSPISEEHGMQLQNVSPRAPSPGQNPFASNADAAAAAAAGGAAGAGLARKTSMRRDGAQKVDLTVPSNLSPMPPSPAGTEFSMSSVSPGVAPAPSGGAAAIAAAGGPPNSAVHRVQLDFKPTLEDEMGLRAGDLVRLLHEYDDGWALCIRLDRSQQGVVPRTCLSTRPVKPRNPQGGPRAGPPVNPNGPPRGSPGPNYPPGQRPLTPQGMAPQGRPQSPGPRPRTTNGPRPASPAGPYGRNQSPMGRPMSPAGRPMSPAGRGPRGQSPGPRQGPPGGRSQSPSGMNRRMSPPGPSPMNPGQGPPRQGPPSSGSPNGPPNGPVGRKPVPGQAY